MAGEDDDLTPAQLALMRQHMLRAADVWWAGLSDRERLAVWAEHGPAEDGS